LISYATFIYLRCLRSAYIYNADAAARDSLRKYAFKPYDPGVAVDFISNTAAVNLVMAEILLDNVEGAVRAMDSIIFRIVPDGMRVHYLAKKAEVLVNDAGDSSYIAIIDSLLVLYPMNNDVLTAKYMVSQDTTYAIWYAKRGGDRAVGSEPSTPEIVSYPTPASSIQTVRIGGLGEITNVILYDYLGRKVDKSHYSYSRAGDNMWFTYDLENGMYIQTIVATDHVYVNKVLINRTTKSSR
jgi:hypothetical protein